MSSNYNFLTEDEAFWYCSKDNLDTLKALENFIPLSDLLEDSVVSNTYYNVIGTLDGKEVIVI